MRERARKEGMNGENGKREKRKVAVREREREMRRKTNSGTTNVRQQGIPREKDEERRWRD